MIDQKRFLYLVRNHPFFALEVMKIMADRLRRFDDDAQVSPNFEPALSLSKGSPIITRTTFGIANFLRPAP